MEVQPGLNAINAINAVKALNGGLHCLRNKQTTVAVA